MSLSETYTASLNKKRYPRFIPYNGKIADITHADTNKHTLDLATALSETRTIIAVYLGVERMGGTGDFLWYPNEGSQGIRDYSRPLCQCIVIAAGTQRVQYALLTANDDYDCYCWGYIVED